MNHKFILFFLLFASLASAEIPEELKIVGLVSIKEGITTEYKSGVMVYVESGSCAEGGIVNLMIGYCENFDCYQDSSLHTPLINYDNLNYYSQIHSTRLIKKIINENYQTYEYELNFLLMGYEEILIIKTQIQLSYPIKTPVNLVKIFNNRREIFTVPYHCGQSLRMRSF